MTINKLKYLIKKVISEQEDKPKRSKDIEIDTPPVISKKPENYDQMYIQNHLKTCSFNKSGYCYIYWRASFISSCFAPIFVQIGIR